MILIDKCGRPIAKPDAPDPDASIADKIAYIRARNAWADRVADIANKAFAKELRFPPIPKP